MFMLNMDFSSQAHLTTSPLDVESWLWLAMDWIKFELFNTLKIMLSIKKIHLMYSASDWFPVDSSKSKSCLS